MTIEKMKPIDYFSVLFKGLLLGITSVGIPGLSASTLSIVLGIYFLMINSIADLFKDFKKNIKFVAPLLIGFIIGVGLAAYTIVIFFEKMPLLTTFVIVGFIISSLPNMIYNLRNHFKKPSCIITFVVIFTFLTSYNIIRPQSLSMQFPEKVSFVYLSGMAVVGMFAAATFIIPGIDFAVIMLSIGIYYPFMNMIKSSFEFSNPNYLDVLANNGMILTAFLLGLLIGLAIFSRLIKHLTKKHNAETQFASLAFVVSAPIVLIKNCIIDTKLEVKPNDLILLIIVGITVSLIFFSIKLITKNLNRAKLAQSKIIEADTIDAFLTDTKIKNK